MSDVYDPDPYMGPAAQRGSMEYLANQERWIGKKAAAEQAAKLAAAEAALKARVSSAAPVVGQAGMNKIDPVILAAILRATRNKE